MTDPIKKKFITDEKGNKKAVILDIKTYEQLIEEIDELNCALGYDQAKEETDKELAADNYLTLDKYIEKRKKTKLAQNDSKQ